MGQKVNPHGARVGVIFGWSTRWYADKKDFANNLVEDFKLRKMIKEKYYAAGISRIDIERTAKDVTVNIMTSDAESFRRSRTRVASDIARAVAFGRRGM